MIYASVEYRHDCGTIVTAKFAAKDIDTMLKYVGKEIRADDRVSKVLKDKFYCQATTITHDQWRSGVIISG